MWMQKVEGDAYTKVSITIQHLICTNFPHPESFWLELQALRGIKSGHSEVT